MDTLYQFSSTRKMSENLEEKFRHFFILKMATAQSIFKILRSCFSQTPQFLEALASLGVGMSVTKSGVRCQVSGVRCHTLEVLVSLSRSCMIFTELGTIVHYRQL